MYDTIQYTETSHGRALVIMTVIVGETTYDPTTVSYHLLSLLLRNRVRNHERRRDEQRDGGKIRELQEREGRMTEERQTEEGEETKRGEGRRRDREGVVRREGEREG